MNTEQTYSMYGELKYPMLAVCVEKPPVAIVVNEWHMESKAFIGPR